MTDDFMRRFDDLDYPGRRKPLNREVSKPPKTESTDWADKPLKYKVNGKDQEFFSIGHLANALGYSVQSIRAWEQNNLLPRSPFRAPTPRRANQPEQVVKGRRLWTREQIEGILRIAQEEGVLLNRKQPTPAFARKVAILFQELLRAHNHTQ